MAISAYKIEISKRDQKIAELLQRNQELESEKKELESENRQLKELLHNKGKSNDIIGWFTHCCYYVPPN